MPRRPAAGERLNRGGLVHVVAGVVRDARGQVLIAERPAGKHLAGGWEFPGGKLDPGETRFAALVRELDEELGLAVLAAHPLLAIRHHYPDRSVLLDVWTVTGHRGEPRGRDGQHLRWCAIESLHDAGLLPADRPVVTALRLPERLTAPETAVYRLESFGAARPPAPAYGPAARLYGVRCEDSGEAAAAAAAGADFVALRGPLPPRGLESLCESVDLPVYARGVELEEAWALGASGVDATP